MNNENGAQLFARLVSVNSQSKHSQSLNASKLTQIENILMINKKLDLDFKIFPNGIKNKEIIEIFGKSDAGKTEIIMHLMAKSLLPTKWKIDLKGSNFHQEFRNKEEYLHVDLSEYSSYISNEMSIEDYDEPEKLSKVIFIETLSKFSILRLFKILENRLLRSFQKLKERSEIASKLKPTYIQGLINKFLKDCLKNLVIFKCFNNEQFILSLSACDHFIQSTCQCEPEKANRNIIPIFIDSVNSNYEPIDKYHSQMGISEPNFTENYGIILIKRLVERFNVSIIASRLDCANNYLNGSNSFYQFKKWQGIVDKRLELNETLRQDYLVQNDSEENYENEDQINNFQTKFKSLNLIDLKGLTDIQRDRNIQQNFKSQSNTSNEYSTKYSIDNYGINII